jgi:hypothetical protein
MSREQAEAIAEFERAGSEREPPSQRMPLVAEILLYLGVVLTLAAGAVIVQSVYQDLSRLARLAIPAVAAAILVAGALTLRNREDAAIQRFGSFLALLGVAATAWFFAGLTLDVEDPADWWLLAVGLGSFVVATPLYRAFLRTPPQIALFASLGLSAGGLAILLAPTGDEAAWFGVMALAVSIAWLAAGARGRLVPPATALALGSIGVVVAPVFLFDPYTRLAIIVGIGSAVGVLTIGASISNLAILVIGGIGLFAWLFTAIQRYFGGSVAAPVALAISGLVLVGVAFWFVRGRKARGQGRT